MTNATPSKFSYNDVIENILNNDQLVSSPVASDITASKTPIEVFGDEELLHDIRPSFLGSLTKIDVILSLFTVGLWLPVPFLKWWNTRYVITDSRFVEKSGSLTGSATVETRYDDVTGEIRTRQGFLEGLLDRGTIAFQIEKTKGKATTEREFGDREGSKREMEIKRKTITLAGIRNYREVANTIRRIQAS